MQQWAKEMIEEFRNSRNTMEEVALKNSKYEMFKKINAMEFDKQVEVFNTLFEMNGIPLMPEKHVKKLIKETIPKKLKLYEETGSFDDKVVDNRMIF